MNSEFYLSVFIWFAASALYPTATRRSAATNLQDICQLAAAQILLCVFFAWFIPTDASIVAKHRRVLILAGVCHAFGVICGIAVIARGGVLDFAFLKCAEVAVSMLIKYLMLRASPAIEEYVPVGIVVLGIVLNFRTRVHVLRDASSVVLAIATISLFPLRNGIVKLVGVSSEFLIAPVTSISAAVVLIVVLVNRCLTRHANKLNVLSTIGSSTLFLIYQWFSLQILSKSDVLQHAVLNNIKRSVTIVVSIFLNHTDIMQRIGFGDILIMVGLGICLAQRMIPSKRWQLSVVIASCCLLSWALFDVSRPSTISIGAVAGLHPRMPLRLLAISWHRHDYANPSSNIGDAYSTPRLYFPDIFSRHAPYVDIYSRPVSADVVVVGGGGLIACVRKWDENLSLEADGNKTIIAWGIGHNSGMVNGTLPKLRYPSYLDKFALVGIRDWVPDMPHNFRFVPCASAMMTLLDKPYEIKRQVGVYISKYASMRTPERFREAVKGKTVGYAYNGECTIKASIAFLGESEVILTNSYHGLYWSTLLGKRVVLMEKTSTKFEAFKWPAIDFSGDLDRDVHAAKVYPHALYEARELNIRFAQEVGQYLQAGRRFG